MSNDFPFRCARYAPLEALIQEPQRGVWKALDRLRQQTVVLKGYAGLGEGPDKRLIEEFRRISVLHHPAWPGGIELSTAPSRVKGGATWRFFTAPWIEGPSLTVLKGQLDAHQLKHLAQRLLEAVGWLHACGFCHLDLKAEHVLLVDGQWMLMDLMELAGPEHVLHSRPLTGTLDWLAPETLRTGQGSTRADLFSLGRVLEAAGARSEPSLLPLLDALLKEAPEERPASAGAALALLDPSLEAWRMQAPAPYFPLTGPLEPSTLLSWLATAGGSAAVLELTGPGESGRSRALETLWLEYQKEGGVALRVNSATDELTELLPYWLELLAEAGSLSDARGKDSVPSEPDAAVASDDAVLSRSVVRISAALTTLKEQQPSGAFCTPTVFVDDREQLAPRSQRLLTLLGTGGPESGLRLVTTRLQPMAEPRSTLEDIPPAESSPLSTASPLPPVNAETSPSLRVPPWSLTHLVTLADQLLGAGTLPLEHLRALHHASDGLAGPCCTALEAVWRKHTSGRAHESTERSVADALTGRPWPTLLEPLSELALAEAAAEALRILAVVRLPMPVSELHALLSRASQRFRMRSARVEALEQLLNRGLLRRVPQSSGGMEAPQGFWLELAQERLRARLLEGMRPDERQRLERMGGQQLEIFVTRAGVGGAQRLPHPADRQDSGHARRVAQVALHYEAAGAHSLVPSWAQRGAELLVQAGLSEEAAQCSARALSHLADEAPERLELLLLRGEACYACEQYPQAREAFAAARDTSNACEPELNLQARIRGGEGLLAVQARDRIRAQRLLREALQRMPPQAGDSQRRVRWLHTLAYLALQDAAATPEALAEAEETLTQAAPLIHPQSAQAIDQSARESWLRMRKNPTPEQARLEIPTLEATLEAALHAFHVRGAQLVLNRLAEAHLLVGRPDAATRVLERLAALAAMTFSRAAEAAARQNLGVHLIDLGQFQDAEAPLTRALQLFQAGSDRSGVIRSRLALVDALLELRRLPEARALLGECVPPGLASQTPGSKNPPSAEDVSFKPSSMSDWSGSGLTQDTVAWLNRAHLRLELRTIQEKTTPDGLLPEAARSRLGAVAQQLRALGETLSREVPGAIALHLGVMADALECNFSLGARAAVAAEAQALLEKPAGKLTRWPRARLERLRDASTANQDGPGVNPAPHPLQPTPMGKMPGAPDRPQPTLKQLGDGPLEPEDLLRWIQPILETRDEYRLSEALGGLVSSLTGAVARIIWLDPRGTPRRVHGTEIPADEFSRFEKEVLRSVRKTRAFWEETDTLRLPDRAARTIREEGIRSVLCWPILGEGNLLGVLYAAWRQPGMSGRPRIRRLVGGVASLAAQWQPHFQASLEEEADVPAFPGLEGTSPALRQLRRQLHAWTDHPNPRLTVFLKGEVGVGKTHLARLLHDQVHSVTGSRVSTEAPFIYHSLASTSPGVLEKELFGSMPGAYTGAVNSAGCLERASGGTLFLDELGKCPLEIQQKLLTVLSPPHTYTRMGGEKPLTLRCRIIFAANEELETLIRQGKLQHDLKDRLDVWIRIPPLREWGADAIRTLTEQFLRQALEALNSGRGGDGRMGASVDKPSPQVPPGPQRQRAVERLPSPGLQKKPGGAPPSARPQAGISSPERGLPPVSLETHFSPAAIDYLIRFHWPGNVRQLEKLLTRNPMLFQYLKTNQRITHVDLARWLQDDAVEAPDQDILTHPERLVFPEGWHYGQFKHWIESVRQAFVLQGVARFGGIEPLAVAWQDHIGRNSLYDYRKGPDAVNTSGQKSARASASRKKKGDPA